MPVIESKFALLEVEVEKIFADAPPFCEAGFGGAPETFDAVDVPSMRECEDVVAVGDAVMLPVSQIHEPIVATPPIGVNDTANIHFAADNVLQGALFRVRDNLSIDPAIPFEDAEDDRLRSCAAASSPLDALRTEVGLIHFDDATERSFLFTDKRNSPPNGHEIAVDGIPVDTGKRCHLRGRKVECEELEDMSELSL